MKFFLSLIPLVAMTAAATAPVHTNYTTVTGYFAQDDASTNASTFNYTTTNFGLLNRTYLGDKAFDPHNKKTQWQRFANEVTRLNRQSPANVQYKVLFMGRHGEGYHNVAQTYYGTPAWNCYWSLQDGNGTSTWADPRLTANGIGQAEIAHNFWASEIKNQKIPTPQTYYASPLYRCLDTARITFSGLDLPKSQPFIPQIKELLRESLSAHTCDRRSNKTFIHSSFPTYTFEGGFAETDPLWNATYAETNDAQDIRSKALLDDVFSTDDSTWISFTSHSGEISSILRVLGHRTFSLSTGAVIPVLVKYEVDPGKGPLMEWQPWTTFSTCATAPTATSSSSSS